MKNRIWKILFFVFSLLGLVAYTWGIIELGNMLCNIGRPGDGNCTAYGWFFRGSDVKATVLLILPQIVLAVLLVYSIILLNRRP